MVDFSILVLTYQIPEVKKYFYTFYTEPCERKIARCQTRLWFIISIIKCVISIANFIFTAKIIILS